MKCDFFRDEKGRVVAITCGRNHRKPQCSSCKRAASTHLCDFPLRGSKAGKTCDAPLCSACTTRVTDTEQLRAAGIVINTTGEIDFCPAHARALNPARQAR